jgi:hypothetical protein
MIIDRSWTLYGCGKCDGWEPALKAWRSRVPYGAHVEWQPCGHADVGGFCGYRMCITTPEQEDRSLALAPFLMLA